MKKLLMASAVIGLAACNPFQQTPIEGFQPHLMVAAASPDYTTSDVAFIGRTEEKSNVVVEQRIHTTDPSDISINVTTDAFYRIGRSGFDNLSKVALDAKNSTVSLAWQYSLKGQHETNNPNPHSTVSIGNNKAYVSRTDAKTLWVVNTNAARETEFLLTEIDLSIFSAPDTPVAHMTDMVLVDDKMFVLLQRLTGTGWSKSANEFSAVAVIDVNTNTIIDTDSSTPGVQVITFGGVNGSELAYHNGNVYVSAVGNPWSAGTADKYSGGIYSIDALDFSVQTVLDDGDDASHPYGNISGFDVTNEGDIYFVGSQGWGDDNLYFLEANGTEATKISLGEGLFNIGDVKHMFNNVYIGVHAQSAEPFNSAGVFVYSQTENKISSFIEMTYNPTQIEPLY